MAVLNGCETLRRFRGHAVLLAVPERSLREGAEAGEHVVVYKTAIQLGPVMEALERLGRRAEQAGDG